MSSTNDTILISERDVETKLLHGLFTKDLGYPESSLKFAVPVKLVFGREKKTKEADLVIYHNGKPVIVIEAKKPTETIQSGIDQVDSYAFALQAPYSLVTNGKTLVLRGYYSFNSRINILEQNIEDLKKNGWKNLKDLISFSNIVSLISEKANAVAVPDQEKIKDYRRFFRTVHNLIRDNDKLDPAASFDEMSKVLFLKAAEDEWILKTGGQPTLTPEKIEEWENLGQGIEYVNRWFINATQEFYPDIFEENSKINLSIETLKQVLVLTKGFHPRDGDIDVKGRAFEEFLPSQLRGKGLGQFFTPRPVVNFMVDLASISIHDVVLDFACGSGGFLIKAFERMQKLVDQLPQGTWERLGVNKADVMEDIKNSQIHGIDAEPRAARTAKMNMLMWGDGRRVVRGNALDVVDFNNKPYIPEEYSKTKDGSGCTLILANPPFGSSEKKSEILARYELGSRDVDRTSQKTEILFLEKGIKMLRPQGRMLIVIPQGILSNDSYSYVRDYLNSEVEVRAVVSLPTHTFVQSGVQTVKTCVLYVQKFTEEKKIMFNEKTKGKTKEEIKSLLKTDPDFNYPIFLGTSEFIGYEPNGRLTVKEGEKTDLDLILEDYKNQQVLSHPKINLIDFANSNYSEKSSRRLEQTIRGTKKDLKTSSVIQFNETETRLDPQYYLLKYNAGKKLKDFIPLLENIKEHSERFKPQTEDEMDLEYPLLSVTNDGKVPLNEYIRGEDFTQAYKKVSKGDIVYNPYRINIGSIGVVSDEFDGAYVSPAYVVFHSKKYNPQFLVNLLRSPFYKMYIDVVSTGSIRDSVSFDLISTLRIPDIEETTQKQINTLLSKVEASIEKDLSEIDLEKHKVVNELHALLNFK
jgi:type I restriction enzyme M protein